MLSRAGQGFHGHAPYLPGAREVAAASHLPAMSRPTGIEPIGTAPWGTHLCQFYADEQELTDILVPYFEAGLRHDESCLWVTAPCLPRETAWRALQRAVPDLDSYRQRERIEIIPHTEWYLVDGRFDGRRASLAWAHKLEAALARGSAGLRLSDTFWLDTTDATSFVEYEANLDRVLGQHRVLALCTYPLKRCGAIEVVQAMKHHQFALLKRDGAWQRFESFARRELQDELNRARESLRASEQRLHQVHRSHNEFLGVLSHELRNPLAPIKMSLYALDRVAPGSAQATRAKAVIERQVEQLARLIDDLSDVTRIARDKIHLHVQRVDVNRLMKMAVEDHRPMFEKNGLRLEMTLADDAPQVMADPGRLAQVVGHLLRNAATFTPPGRSASLSIATDLSARQVVIQVADQGVGMSSETLSTLFEPFVHSDTSPDGGKSGLGIGLALVKGLVDLHGGQVEARSDGPGQGSTFTVRLPLSST